MQSHTIKMETLLWNATILFWNATEYFYWKQQKLSVHELLGYVSAGESFVDSYRCYQIEAMIVSIWILIRIHLHLNKTC